MRKLLFVLLSGVVTLVYADCASDCTVGHGKCMRQCESGAAGRYECVKACNAQLEACGKSCK